MTAGKIYFGAGVVNGTLYAAGGITGSGETGTLTSAVEAYSAASNSWSQAASMLSIRENFGVASCNGYLYAIDGFTGPNVTDTVEQYNPSTNGWSYVQSMPVSLEEFGTGVVNGIIYVVGGTGYLNSVYTYNPTSNAWSTVSATMPTGRSSLAVGVVNGILYAVGGENSNGVLSTVEAYSPTTNAWSEMAPMPTARENLTVSVVGSTLYAIGGDSGVNGTDLGTVEAYNTATNSWAEMNPIPTVRTGLASGVVNGTIYAIGGFNSNSDFLTTNEAGVSLCATFTATPTGGSGDVVLNKAERAGGTPTPTFTPTSTPTATPSPTPTPIPVNEFLAFAAPNISRNGEPIRFQVELGNPASLQLSIYSLTGELVYQSAVEGSIGFNSILWNLGNQTNNPVASGLYVYVLRGTEGSKTFSKVGKVVLLR